MIPKRNLPHWITVVSFVVFVVLGLACATVEPLWEGVVLTGETDGKVLEGQAYTITILVDWAEGALPGVVSFFPNGKAEAYGDDYTWERVGTKVRLVSVSGHYQIEGVHDPAANTITGTMSRSDDSQDSVLLTLFGDAGASLYSNEKDFTTNGSSWDSRGETISVGTRMIPFTSITGYTGSDTNLRIPTVIDQILVTSIGRQAFRGKGITRVTIPGRVNAGQWRTIQYMSTLGSSGDVRALAGIGSIGDGAFADNRLTSIVLPDNIRSIGAEAFANNQLTSVTFGKELVSIGAGAFANNQLTSITIPSTVRQIGNNAFAGNPLTNVTVSIAEGATGIADNAYANIMLSDITIPSSVTSIGKGAFANNKLTGVTIPAGVREIGSNAFAGNPLTSIIIQNGIARIGEEAFANITTLTGIALPDSVTHLAGSAFTGSNNIIEITIGPNVTLTGSELMPFNFRGAYLENSLRAGTYRFVNGAWTVEFR